MCDSPPTPRRREHMPWESGAEDARTPNADAWSASSAAREAFGVRPIYRRFPSGVRRPNVCAKGERVLSMNLVWSPAFSRSGPPKGGTLYRWDDPDGFMVPIHRREAEEALSMNRR